MSYCTSKVPLESPYKFDVRLIINCTSVRSGLSSKNIPQDHPVFMWTEAVFMSTVHILEI